MEIPWQVKPSTIHLLIATSWIDVIGHHCSNKETMDNIISNILVFKWVCKAVMALRVDLLLRW